MKSIKCLMLLPGFFFFVSTSMAVESKTSDTKKTKAHHCAMFKRNAMKAKHLYALSRAKAQDLKNQVKDLKKDQKRLPAEAKTTKKIVIEKIHLLSDVKTQKLAISLKYLENHIYFITVILVGSLLVIIRIIWMY